MMTPKLLLTVLKTYTTAMAPGAFEHFDAEASRLREYYDADASRRDGGSIQEWKRIERERFVGAVRIIGAAARPRVLELGSGTGRDAQYFAEE